MKGEEKKFTRRDFIKTTGSVALGVAVGLPSVAASQETTPVKKSKVVLVRREDAVDDEGKVNAEAMAQMMDDAVTTLYEKDGPVACWKEIAGPDDVVGIKTNVWRYLPTPPALEQAVKSRLIDAGVPDDKIAIDDWGIRDNPIFKQSTALINARPMRTHAWAGVGSLIKNYIMFVPYPQNYHGDACANLGAIWSLPICKDKTRLNVQVLLTPLFYGIGPHHFDTTYVWGYKGLVVSTDPVAADTIALSIFQAKRREYFGEDKPIQPKAHHIAFADKKFHLGNSDLENIELIKLGWQEGALI
jgi:hypothetical protein